MKSRLLGRMVLFAVSATAMAQQSFSTPDQATGTLANVINKQNESAMSNLLRENWRDFLPPGGVDPDAVDRFLHNWEIRHSTVISGNTAHLVVGDSDWQLPVPVVKNASGWQFDIRGTVEEILTREIGRNRLATIEALHAYVDAQQSYFVMNRKHAQKIINSEGKGDGLYWPVSPGETPNPLGPAPSLQEPGMGYHGCRFRILPGKTSGFTMVVWPVSYDHTDVMSFMINGKDKVCQADLSVESQQRAQTLTTFHPDKNWQPVAP